MAAGWTAFARAPIVRSGLVCAVILVLGSTASLLAQQRGLRIIPLARDGWVHVSVNLTDGFTDEVRAAIRSGLKTTFTYTVDLQLDVPIGFDRRIGTSTVTSSVVFDNLERRYTVVRFLDGRGSETFQTEDEAVVKQWMTEMVKLPLFRTTLLEPNRDYYVRVSATARPSGGSLLWPFSSGTSGQTKFTFIR